MKQFLAILIAAVVASASVSTAFAADKKPVAKAETKKVKKHKKAEASGKVADDKPKAPAKKK